MAKENVYLASKPRYEILDGLRGVAALMVILFHCFETYIPIFGTQHINHGYLAVDFFFVLGGTALYVALLGMLPVKAVGRGLLFLSFFLSALLGGLECFALWNYQAQIGAGIITAVHLAMAERMAVAATLWTSAQPAAFGDAVADSRGGSAPF